MTQAVAAQVGSGTLPYTYGILSLANRGNEPTGRGERTGIQVMLGNPEDLVAVDAFAASGITVGVSGITGYAIEILGPYNNPLPRCREVIVENGGTTPVYVSHKESFSSTDAFELLPHASGMSSRVTLPVLHNVSIYAKTDTGTSIVRLLIF